MKNIGRKRQKLAGIVAMAYGLNEHHHKKKLKEEEKEATTCIENKLSYTPLLFDTHNRVDSSFVAKFVQNFQV
jgi:hypothetical protein